MGESINHRVRRGRDKSSPVKVIEVNQENNLLLWRFGEVFRNICRLKAFFFNTSSIKISAILYFVKVRFTLWK